MSIDTLTLKTCTPCNGNTPALTAAQATRLSKGLNEEWLLDHANGQISRTFKTKAFARAMQIANLAGFIGEKEGHHPDIAFGWGYCRVTFTTHAIGGLSENDFICAAKIDAAMT